MMETRKRANLPQREDNEGQRRCDCPPLPISTPVHSSGRHTIPSTGPRARFPLESALRAAVDPQALIKKGLRFSLSVL